MRGCGSKQRRYFTAGETMEEFLPMEVVGLHIIVNKPGRWIIGISSFDSDFKIVPDAKKASYWREFPKKKVPQFPRLVPNRIFFSVLILCTRIPGENTMAAKE